MTFETYHRYSDAIFLILFLAALIFLYYKKENLSRKMFVTFSGVPILLLIALLAGSAKLKLWTLSTLAVVVAEGLVAGTSAVFSAWGAALTLSTTGSLKKFGLFILTCFAALPLILRILTMEVASPGP